MAMGDYCDYSKYVVKMKDLTTDIQQLVDFVNEVPATGGGDAPEVSNHDTRYFGSSGLPIGGGESFRIGRHFNCQILATTCLY
jgi:hypothetical protein